MYAEMATKGVRHQLAVIPDTCLHEKEGVEFINTCPETQLILHILCRYLEHLVYTEQQQPPKKGTKFWHTCPIFFHHETVNQASFLGVGWKGGGRALHSFAEHWTIYNASTKLQSTWLIAENFLIWR